MITNEEAIVILENEKPHCGRRITFTEEEKCEAFEMAVAALKGKDKIIDAHYMKGFSNGVRTEKFRASKRELCEDAVRRLIKDKIDILEDRASTENNEGRWVEDEKCCYAIEVLEEILEEIADKLPPATPKPRTGKWIREPIRNEKGGCIGAKMICSECGHDNKHDEYMDYCPNCGIKMEGRS